LLVKNFLKKIHIYLLHLISQWKSPCQEKKD
jgi:hypothetical protein